MLTTRPLEKHNHTPIQSDMQVDKEGLMVTNVKRRRKDSQNMQTDMDREEGEATMQTTAETLRAGSGHQSRRLS